ncbi:MAG: hypothetical protein HFJ28_02510 [Clostridia bacterium]|nr:hypothetical protein [Clostridia bacterium]
MKGELLVLAVCCVILSFILAREKRVQKFVLENKQKNFFIEPDEESVVEQMKEIAQKTFEGKKIPVEESKQYDIYIQLREEKINEVEVRTQRSIVKKTKNEITYKHRGCSPKIAMLMTWGILVAVEITAMYLGLALMIFSYIIRM